MRIITRDGLCGADQNCNTCGLLVPVEAIFHDDAFPGLSLCAGCDLEVKHIRSLNRSIVATVEGDIDDLMNQVSEAYQRLANKGLRNCSNCKGFGTALDVSGCNAPERVWLCLACYTDAKASDIPTLHEGAVN